MSSIKIYKTNITPDRNALVDNLSTYLSSLTPAYSNDTFQYIQLSTDISIKVELDQEMQVQEIGNYVDLFQDNKHFYFFILKSNWKSTKTIELSLSIDSVNTFKDDFTFNKKYIPYPEGYTRRDGAAPTGAGYPIEDTWNCSFFW